LKYDGVVTSKQIEEMIDKLGGVEGVRRFLGEEPPLVLQEAHAVPEPRRWNEQNSDNVISFTVTSDGTTGQGWITRLEASGKRVDSYAKSVLRAKDFKPTNGVTMQIRVLKSKLWSDENIRTIRNIRAEADRRQFIKPNAEVGCLIRDLFSNEEIKAMGIWWIVVMHNPIEDSDGFPSLLAAGRGGGGYSLGTYSARPGDRWDRGNGFAFVLP
jgi:hypothetical protein